MSHPEQRFADVAGFEFPVLDPRDALPGERLLQVGRFPEQAGGPGRTVVCTSCGETLVCDVTEGPTIVCGICALLLLKAPSMARAPFVAALQELRERDPEALADLVLTCLHAAGVGRVWPSRPEDAE